MSDAKLDYERRDVSVAKIAIFGFLPAVFLVVSIVALNYVFKNLQFQESLVKSKADSSEIDTLRSKAKNHLSKYSKKSDRAYTLPIDKAIDAYIKP